MMRFVSMLWRLFLLGLVVGSTSLLLAQDTTPNPIFSPLGDKTNQTDTNDGDLSDVEDVTIDDEVDSVDEVTDSESDLNIEKVEHNVLRRPIKIADDRVHWVDRTYPYGSTQWGLREVHLGVEFVNPRFTPIFASAAGEVVFAGSDSEFPIGPYENYYGIVIIISHDISSLDGEQVFTLYGHLDRVEVEEGQQVEIGDRIARVGSSGIAAGPHLHFEVRVGEPFDYRFTRNPELWIQHYVDHGLIAGYVHDSEGNPIQGQRLVVRSDTVNREIFTYGSDRVNIDPVWHENFTVGDLPPNEYEIVILNDKGLVVYRNFVTVEAYKTAFVDILLEDK